MLPYSLSLKPCLSHISHQVRVDYRELEGTSVKAGRLEFELGDGTGGEAIRLALMSMRRAETARVRLRRRLLAPPLAEVEEGRSKRKKQVVSACAYLCGGSETLRGRVQQRETHRQRVYAHHISRRLRAAEKAA